MSNAEIGTIIEIAIGVVLLAVIVLTVYACLIKLRSSKSNILKKYGTEDDTENSGFASALVWILPALIVLLVILLFIN